MVRVWVRDRVRDRVRVKAGGIAARWPRRHNDTLPTSPTVIMWHLMVGV